MTKNTMIRIKKILIVLIVLINIFNAYLFIKHFKEVRQHKEGSSVHGATTNPITKVL